MVSGDVTSVGLELIESSGLEKKTKQIYRRWWLAWLAWCEQEGVDALTAAGSDALRCLQSLESQWQVSRMRHIVNFVCRGLGIESPMMQREVREALGWRNERHMRDADRPRPARLAMCYRLSDYESWCEQNGKSALPGSGEQSAEFLLFMSDWYAYRTVIRANGAVSRYLEGKGYRGTSHHPAVVVALHECRARIEAREGKRNGVGSEGSGDRANREQMQWRDWCDAEDIDWHKARPADALRHLRGLEHQATAGTRARRLSKLYAGVANPFSSEVVVDWRKRHAQAVDEGTLPKVVRSVSRADEVIGRIREARAIEIEVVPEGLTREELEGVQEDVRNDIAESTLRDYARQWARFDSWLIDRLGDRKTAMAKVTGWHVAVYLESLAEGRRLSTIQGVGSALAMVFDEFGFVDNPALSIEVERYMKKLERQRREAPAQVDGFREEHFQAVLEVRSRALAGKMGARQELSAVTDIFMLGMMFDGLLRSAEMVAVRQQDVSQFSDESGRLLVPYSKTDPFGNGEVTYVSGRTMEARDRLNGLRGISGLGKAGDDRILQFGKKGVRGRVLNAFKDAGLEGRWGTHSMRVGMAQELAVAGFGLVLIMRAGRWETPDMPALYIRGLKLDEAAVAVLHRLWAEGKARVDADAKGDDVLSTYNAVRYAM